MIKTAQLANILAFGGYLAPCLAGTGDGPETFNENILDYTSTVMLNQSR